MPSAISTITKKKIKPNLSIKEPCDYRVILLDDDTTPFDFVVETLMVTFGYDEDIAETIADEVHDATFATAAILNHEMAEQKSVELTIHARTNGFPLQVKLEPLK